MRNAVIVLGLIGVLGVIGSVVAIRVPRASSGWQEFAVGAATGGNTNIGLAAIRSEGISVRSLISVAYAIPQTRIVGPDWLGYYRYSVIAVVRPEGAESMRSLLQQELANRMKLRVREEERDFDVFVLHAKGKRARLTRAERRDTNIEVHPGEMRAREATMSDLANVLQDALGKAVVDETAIDGWYNFELKWSENTGPAVAAALESGLGLQFEPGRRRLTALIVDHVEVGKELWAIAKLGLLTNRMPNSWRFGISRAMAAH